MFVRSICAREMRMRSVHVLLFLIFHVAYGTSEPSSWSYWCKNLKSTSALLRLKSDLFCDYDTTVRPSDIHGNATTVNLDILLRSIEVDDTISIVDAHTWMVLSWKDNHLTWDPVNYDGISWLQLVSYEIWLPDIMVHSATDLDVTPDVPITRCGVFHDGMVYCDPGQMHTAFCTSNHEWWPYDVKNCTIQYGSWSHSTEDIRIRIAPGASYELREMEDYQMNMEWDLVRSYLTQSIALSKFREDMKTDIISLCIFLKRHSNMYSSIYVPVAIVLMVMTLMTLWLEPKSTERMITANFNFLCHLLCVQQLVFTIPPSGNNTPKILLFCDYSFMLATFSLILTSILRYVQELNTEAPMWITSGTASILHSKIGQILLLSILDPKVSARIEMNADDNTDLVSAHRKVSAWKYVSVLIGWFVFLTVSVIYVVVLAVHVPTSSHGDLFKPNS